MFILNYFYFLLEAIFHFLYFLNAYYDDITLSIQNFLPIAFSNRLLKILELVNFIETLKHHKIPFPLFKEKKLKRELHIHSNEIN